MHVRFIHTELEGLGIEYLSAVLRKAGHSTDLVIDFQDTGILGMPIRLLQHRSGLIRKILSGNPGLIAFSVTSNNIEWAYRTAEEIKANSRVPIVFGGIQATLIPDAVISKDFVDFVVVGEGEYPLLNLANTLERGGSFESIGSLYYKKDGAVFKNGLDDLESNLDKLPFPDKELFRGKNMFFGNYSIMTGRGCVGICTYCCVPFVKNMYFGKGDFLRRRSPANVIAELVRAKRKYGIKRVIFEDDLFTYDKKWLKEFSDSYSERVSLPCILCSHPNFLDEEVVSSLKKIKCKMVEIGVQSLNEEIRSKVLKRYYTNEKLTRGFELLNKNGICCIADNIIGLPGEKDSDVVEMLRFYNRLRPGKIDIFYLKYYPGLEITRKSGLGSADLSAISNGIKFSPPIVEADENFRNSRMLNKLILTATLMYIFPRKLVSLILDRKFYRFFPCFRSCYRINEVFFYFSLFFRKKFRGAFISLRGNDFVKLRMSLQQFFNRN